MLCKKIEETDAKREALIKEIAEFLGKVFPKLTSHQQVFPKTERSDMGAETPRRLKIERVPVFRSTSSPTSDIVYETTETTDFKIKEEEDEETDIDAEVKSFGREHYGEIASPFLSQYLSNTRLLDTQ